MALTPAHLEFAQLEPTTEPAQAEHDVQSTAEESVEFVRQALESFRADARYAHLWRGMGLTDALIDRIRYNEATHRVEIPIDRGRAVSASVSAFRDYLRWETTDRPFDDVRFRYAE